MTAQRTHGGKRAHAGRPVLPPEQRRVVLSLMVAPETAAWLRARRAPPAGLGQVVDDLVTRAMSRDDPAAY